MIPYKLTFEERPGYLYALVQAPDIDRETALAYLQDVAAKSVELKFASVLLERDIPTMLPDADLFFTTNDFMRLMEGRRVAFLNPHLPIDADMSFAVSIASNRGVEFQLHRNLKEAEAWLAAG